jgi:Protein of unknown function (DUF2442)
LSATSKITLLTFAANGKVFMATEKRRISKIDDSVFAKASERGRRLLTRGPLATAARYTAGRIHVELNNGCAFEFPVKHAQGLAGAKATDLRNIEIQASGLSLHWPRIDADLYVPALVKGVLGTQQWMAEIGAAGGKVASRAKAAAARANGKLGGRPKKSIELEAT